MKKLFTKKYILIISSIFISVLVILVMLQENRNCYDSWSWCRNYVWNFLESEGPFLTPFLSILLCSLITYKLRDAVFNTWLKGTAVMLPIMLFFILRSSESAYGGALASAMTVTRAEAALQLSVIYFALSLILIAYKSFAIRKKG